jgi:non-heme chloroperoxidase
MTIAPWERAELEAANSTGKQPVVFVHGLWLLASSWHDWRELFDARGFTTIAPGWPGDPADLDAARKRPSAFEGQKIGMVAGHYEEIISSLTRKPVIIGHSFGGLIAQILIGRGLSVGGAAIDPAPHRGVLPLPISALRGASPVLRNPLNYKRAVTLTFKQFKYGFANAVPEPEAKDLYDRYHVPAPGAPLFQAAVANMNPWSETKVNVRQPNRGPVIFITGERDHLAPWAITNASFKRWNKHSDKPTEIIEVPDRGHSLILDHGWPEVAETILAFLQRHGVEPRRELALGDNGAQDTDSEANSMPTGRNTP